MFNKTRQALLALALLVVVALALPASATVLRTLIVELLTATSATITTLNVTSLTATNISGVSSTTFSGTTVVVPTLSAPTVTSSMTIKGAGGLGVTYGITAGSGTFTSGVTATVVGSATLNVLKTGDTMSGQLKITVVSTHSLDASGLVNSGAGFAMGGSTILFRSNGGLDDDNLVIGKDAGTACTWQGCNSNTFIGDKAGRNTSSGDRNVFIGVGAGYGNTAGASNIRIGTRDLAAGATKGQGESTIAIGPGAAQNLDIDAPDNIALGRDALRGTTAYDNVCIGGQACQSTSGNGNTVIGRSALSGTVAASSNTILGYLACSGSARHGNVCIGYRAGELESGSDKLYIDNSGTASPLIKGDFSANTVTINGALTVESLNSPSYTAGAVTISPAIASFPYGVTAATATFSTSVAAPIVTVSAAFQPAIKTKAQFDAMTPAVGDVYLCSDCVISYSVCVGTGAVLSGFKVSHSATVGCGSGN